MLVHTLEECVNQGGIITRCGLIPEHTGRRYVDWSNVFQPSVWLLIFEFIGARAFFVMAPSRVLSTKPRSAYIFSSGYSQLPVLLFFGARRLRVLHICSSIDNKVDWIIPCWRQTSETFWPGSTSFKIQLIWCWLNLDGFIGFLWLDYSSTKDFTLEWD